MPQITKEMQMVQLRTDNSGKRTWVLEGDTLKERLEELAVIFNYHSKASNKIEMDPRFTAEMLEMQTRGLMAMAEKQEQELKELRKVAEEFVLFKAEMKAALQALKKPDDVPALDKPRFKPPGSSKK